MTEVRLRAFLLTFVAAALMLAACGGDASESSPTPTSATATATSSPTTATAGSPTTTTAPSAAATATVSDTGAPTAQPPAATQPPAPPATNPPAAGVTLLTPVDKDHALPASYVPPGLAVIPGPYLAPGFGGELRQEALDALVSMLDNADAAGHDIRARSAYRSYATQESTFNFWVNALGYDAAVKVSAMAGHSEHQLGTTVDLTSPAVGWDLLESFGQTPEGQWLAANAHNYGFALSYPAGAEAATGYTYEPWHFRYIGIAQALAWNAIGLTLNQYLLQ